MDFYQMTDKAICAEIGSRLKDLRLRRNLTRQQVAQVAAVSLNVVKSLEMGKGKLSSLASGINQSDCISNKYSFSGIICTPSFSAFARLAAPTRSPQINISVLPVMELPIFAP